MNPALLRPCVQPEKHGLKLKMVLKWRDNYVEFWFVSLIAALKMERVVKWRGLELQGPLYLMDLLNTSILKFCTPVAPREKTKSLHQNTFTDLAMFSPFNILIPELIGLKNKLCP